MGGEPVAAGFVTTARFVTTACFAIKVSKRVAMPAGFVTNEVIHQTGTANAEILNSQRFQALLF